VRLASAGARQATDAAGVAYLKSTRAGEEAAW